MERDKRAPKMNSSENPLNVASEKIEETRARVYGDYGNGSIKDALIPSRATISAIDETEEDPRLIDDTADRSNSAEIVNEDKDFDGSSEDENNGNVVPEFDENHITLSCASDESETALLALSENEKWLRRNFKRPLIFAMRDIVAKQPNDPVDYLAAWLLNYRCVQERTRSVKERDQKLAEERKRIQDSFYSETFLKSEESNDLAYDAETFGEGNQVGDNNFEDYEIP